MEWAGRGSQRSMVLAWELRDGKIGNLYQGRLAFVTFRSIYGI